MRIADTGSGVNPGRSADFHREVEKPRASNPLQDERLRAAPGRDKGRATSGGNLLSRSGTEIAHASPAIGPSAGFAAQVIGQIMGAGQTDARDAAAAYARAEAGNPDLKLIRFA